MKVGEVLVGTLLLILGAVVAGWALVAQPAGVASFVVSIGGIGIMVLGVKVLRG